jgi:spore germination protein GerM
MTEKGSVLTLDMPPAFQAWVTRNLAEERAFVKAAVLTLTSFQDITAVRFTINGRPMRASVGPFELAEPISRPTAVNSLPAANNATVLYLKLRDSDLLVPWAVPAPRRDPAVALQELIRFRGHERLVSPVPRNLAVQSVRVEEGLAIVNLDKASVSLFLQGTVNQQLVLDALVYTLLEFPGIKGVQFLVDGRVLAPLGANIDLSKPIGRTGINRVR